MSRTEATGATEAHPYLGESEARNTARESRVLLIRELAMFLRQPGLYSNKSPIERLSRIIKIAARLVCVNLARKSRYRYIMNVN